MAKIKLYTDLEQSKKLSKILPIESADNYYSWHDEQYYVVNKDCPYPYSLKEKIPCWSLAALLGVIPEVSLNTFKDGKWNVMVQHDGKIIYEDKDNPVDACYEMILRLNELKIL